MESNKTSKENLGLSTQEALNKLHLEISNILEQNSKKGKHLWLRDTFHHCSQNTNINWISGIILFLATLALLISSYYTHDNQSEYILESVILSILLILNITTDLYDNYLRHNEVSARVHHVLNTLQCQISRIRWLPEHYPHLCTPFSPCITLQWTYRDNKIVNLPWALLVKDDIILMRPGQICPGYSECLERNAEYPLLHAKEVYGPALHKAKEIFSIPKARKPLNSKKYKLLETPYVNNLRIALEQSLDRPVTQHNQSRHLLLRRVIERIILPATFTVTIFVSTMRCIYFNSDMNTWKVDLFVIVPVCIILPLLPVLFPIAWNVLTYLGMSRFNILLEYTRKVDYKDKDQFDDQDLKTEVFPKIKYEWHKTWKHVLDIFQGNENMLTRTANILHVLGSVTALCCIDKKGILSWPNPSAEKVFFLHNTDNLSESSSLANLGELHTDGDSVKGGLTADSTHIEETGAASAEVLDVTYNHADPFKLQFDDPKWMDKYLTSLKPLGLSILLNTCNIDTQEQYTEFCSHITCEAMYNENLIPVTNRRCLCELAKEIGFVEKAREIFSLEKNLSTFRHLQTDVARRDHNKYARSLSLTTRLKHPFPHMFAVVVRELSTGSMQLLSQGTADLVLDSCVDYWDGYDLCPLTAPDRKRALDFYQRGSLTAYCSAFAYRPLSKGVSNKLSEIYLELPSDCRHLYQSHRSPTSVNWDTRSVLEPKLKTTLGQFYSTDSLLYNDSPGSDVSDTDSCFEMQCNQVFIGMVTMQYQAQADMVYLIEQLERACIRFVHFSKENELRSRVFSEKMGLESGWNCHISLLSDRNSNLASSRTMSFSAPSAINMENTKVRFDNERIERQPLIKANVSTEGPIKTENYNENDPRNTSENQKTSLESIESAGKDLNMKEHPHDWQSLSCLTDSTEQSAPVNFDMSNRAKLPRGIDKIRPHIELIDNVPLLVSLFTDCTPSSTREMLQIMQDYGEVVCVLGSSANYENIGIFMQADASIAVEPLYPQVCQKQDSFQKCESDYFSPIELSRNLNSVACSLSLRREEPISLIFLVAKARHYISALWNVVQFWICCCISLSTMQLAASFSLLPSLLTPRQVIWLICVIIPTLSISLIGTRTDYGVMNQPKRKKQLYFNVEALRFVMWCYGTKFLTVIFIVLVVFSLFLVLRCFDICNLYNCQCLLFYLPIDITNGTGTDAWTPIDHSETLFFIQHVNVVLIFTQYVTVSISFVYRDYNIWNKSPHSNYLWLATIIMLILLQVIFTLTNIQGINERVPLMLLIFILTSPVITFAICELVKREEIKINLRYQRRARLDFGTKLGMNSPF